MKIYTKKGDFGETDLLTKRVKKSDPAIMINGDIDELMATIIMTKHYLLENDQNQLDQIHQVLFNMAYELALESQKPQVLKKDTLWLEEQIDLLDQKLKPLKAFIKLDQNLAQSWLNMCRVKTRSLERTCLLYQEQLTYNPHTLAYLNRLSDYFFTIARTY